MHGSANPYMDIKKYEGYKATTLQDLHVKSETRMSNVEDRIDRNEKKYQNRNKREHNMYEKGNFGVS